MNVEHINKSVIITGVEDPNLMTPEARLDEICHILANAILRILNRQKTQVQPRFMR